MIDVSRERAGTATEPFVLRLADGTSAEALERCIELFLHLGHARILVDLAFRESLDADYLTVLRRSASRIRRLGGVLGVVCRTATLRRLLDLTLLGQSVAVHTSRPVAVAALREIPTTLERRR